MVRTLSFQVRYESSILFTRSKFKRINESKITFKDIDDIEPFDKLKNTDVFKWDIVLTNFGDKYFENNTPFDEYDSIVDTAGFEGDFFKGWIKTSPGNVYFGIEQKRTLIGASKINKYIKELEFVDSLAREVQKFHR